MAAESTNRTAGIRKIQDEILMELDRLNLATVVDVTLQEANDRRARLRITCGPLIGQCVRDLLRRNGIPFRVVDLGMANGRCTVDVVNIPQLERQRTGASEAVRRKPKSGPTQRRRFTDPENGQNRRSRKKGKKGRGKRRVASETLRARPPESSGPLSSRFQKGAEAFGAGSGGAIRRHLEDWEGFGLNAADREVRGTNFYDR